MKKPKTKLIPSELKALHQWAGWRPQPRKGGKTAKIPISPKTGVFARTNAPRLWGSFEEALHACESGRWGSAGIGFLFTRKDLYVGIDLDHCRDPKTGSMEPWAQEIIDDGDSYTEISPSGTGVHIVVKVKEKPPGLNKRDFGGIEIFVASVYLTFTGDHLPGTPKDIACRDEFFNRLVATLSRKKPSAPARSDPGRSSSHKKAFKTERATITERLAPLAWNIPESNIIARALVAKNGLKFQRLFVHGDDSGYNSPSEADLALCGILAFWTRCDATMMDSIFRKSGLFRKEKWDKVHYKNRKTYGQATIATAISGCGTILGGK